MRVRSASGIYLIELLVAFFVGSLMLLALCALLLQTLRVTSAATNQTIADQIGHSILEYARAVPSGGAYPAGPLQINTDSGAALTAPQQYPLGLDENNYTWSTTTKSGELKGTATSQITTAASGGLAFSVITVTVTWSDSDYVQPHSATYSTVVFQPGENNNNWSTTP